MDIEIDSSYRTRSGKKVRIVAKNRKHHTYGVVGLILQEDETEGVETWSQEGRFSNDSVGEGHPLDLMSPWVEPPMVNWAAMPAWARWVAQDAGGHWRWFAYYPNRKHLPVLMDYLYSNIPPSYAPIYSGPWEDSLVERPAEAD